MCVFKSLVDSDADFVVPMMQPKLDAKYLLELEGAVVKYICSVESSFDIAQCEH